MNIESFRDYCMSKPGVTEGFPFDSSTLGFKVGGKLFALTDVDDFEFVNLKCDPERVIKLRESYNGVRPGYHMNKKHWNSVYPNDDVSDALFCELTDHSYDLVLKSLPKKQRENL